MPNGIISTRHKSASQSLDFLIASNLIKK